MNVSLQTQAAVGGNIAVASMQTTLPLVYLVRREGLSAIFQSQVLKPMSRIAQSGVDVNIVVLCPIGQFLRKYPRKKWSEMIRNGPEALRGRLHRLATPPSRVSWNWWERKSIERRLRRFAARGKPLIIQCRGATATTIALDIKQHWPDLRVVYDCRGLEDEEFRYAKCSNGSGLSAEIETEALRLLALQRRSAHESDAVFCVSATMVDYVVAEYGIDASKCEVVPCCVDVAAFQNGAKHRKRTRTELGLERKFVVAYCGSMTSWQMPRESLRLFQRIRRLERSAHFLAVTRQPDTMQGLIAEENVAPENTTVISVPHQDVPRYLAAADCALLLRKPSPVNQVASPVKFGEYLASGTPVIMSNGIGDYSELVRRENTGVVITATASDEATDDALRKFLDDYRSDPHSCPARCRRVARAHLDHSAYLPRIANVYRRLAL